MPGSRRRLTVPGLDRIFDWMTRGYNAASRAMGDRGLLPPYRLECELTYRCNCRCEHCYQSRDSESVASYPRETMTVDDWLRIALETPPWTLITLTGGEPMLMEGFSTLLDRLGRVRPIILLSNATLLNAEIRRLLIERRVLLLGTALYGPEAYHDAFTGHPGAFAKTLANLEALQREKRAAGRGPLLDFKVAVDEGNVEHVPELVDMAHKLDAEIMTFSLVYRNDAMLNPQLRDSIDDAAFERHYPFGPEEANARERFAETFSKLVQEGRKGRTRFRFYPPFRGERDVRLFFETPERLDRRLRPCFNPWGNLVISPLGEAYPCLSLRLGNVSDTSLRELWRGSAFHAFRRRIRERGTLPACWGCCYVSPDFAERR